MQITVILPGKGDVLGDRWSASPGPRRVAEVEADSPEKACLLAAKRVTVYNNQYLDAVEADQADAAEDEIDSAVNVLD